LTTEGASFLEGLGARFGFLEIQISYFLHFEEFFLTMDIKIYFTLNLQRPTITTAICMGNQASFTVGRASFKVV
jgi:hypothetical protein